MKRIDPSVENLVPHFYEGILDPGLWAEALQGLRDRLQARSFHQLEMDVQRTHLHTIAVSRDLVEAPPAQVAAYEQHYAPQDVRLASMWAMPEGGVWLDHEQLPRKLIESSAVYAEFLAGVGMRHTASLSLREGVQSRDFLGFMRHADQAPYGAAERAMLLRLVPHIARANRLRHRAAALATQASLGMAALEALPQALVLADAACYIRYANAAARGSLHATAGIGVLGGRLLIHDAAQQHALARQVALACSHGGPARAGAVRLPQSGIQVHVLPLQACHTLAQAHGAQPHALLVWTAPASLLLHADQIAIVLGLTGAEAHLAVALARGLSVKEFALAQGCAWHTARTHARNLLRKTGLHRQAEVIDLVRSLMWTG